MKSKEFYNTRQGLSLNESCLHKMVSSDGFQFNTNLKIICGPVKQFKRNKIRNRIFWEQKGRNTFCLIMTSIIALFMVSHVSNAQNDAETKYERALEITGDVLQVTLPTTGLLIAIFEKDHTGIKQHALSFGTNLVLTHSLKLIVNKKRPEESIQYNAFPSGHTSAAFQGASFIQRRYGWKYGIYAYALAALVGYSRIEGLNDRHDIWDVLGGAAVGIGSTYIFTKPKDKDNVDVGFSANSQQILISIKYRL